MGVLNKRALIIVCIVIIVLAVGAIGFQIWRGGKSTVDQETGHDLTEPLELVPGQVPASPDASPAGTQ